MIIYRPYKLFILVIFSISCFLINAQQAPFERFEHLNTQDGLSESSVLSIYCDNEGYMWFGTMNGLNRYDGYYFKIYKSRIFDEYSLTNNRISRIWEDTNNFLWVETYNGYYQYLDRTKDEFYTFPFYKSSEEEKFSRMTVFSQISDNKIWLGSSQSGVYILSYDSVAHGYHTQQFLSRGSHTITNNSIFLIQKDKAGNVWIGAKKGLNMLKAPLVNSNLYSFEHYFIDKQFVCSDTLADNIWFGTQDGTIIRFDNKNKEFINVSKTDNVSGCKINILKSYSGNAVIAGLEDGRIIFYSKTGDVQNQYVLKSPVRDLYTDRDHNVWITTEDYGIHKIDSNRNIKFYTLTPEDIQSLVDDEREYIYEDVKDNLWIGIHGAGLALYDKERDRFNFFRNNPYDPSSISSNFVHCLTNDKSGILWIGTGQARGGINKIIPVNPAFSNVIPRENIENAMDNLVRSIYQDSGGNIWMGSKSGNIYIYNEELELIHTFHDIPSVKGSIPGHNIYTIIQDSEGYILMGSKGGGIAVSEKPLQQYRNNHREIRFNVYRNNPNDTNSLSNNSVYSIIEDRQNRIWIGTFGGGVNLIDRNDLTQGKPVFQRINTSTGNLSSDAIRLIYEDSKGRIWIGTTFGISLLVSSGIKSNATDSFINFIYTPDNKNSLSYNDIIYIFEDSDNKLWFGTFGGGVNRLVEKDDSIIRFDHFTSADGLCNNAVFGILEDDLGFLWFSTEQGISRYDPKQNTVENYDENNGLISDKFLESTCLKTRNGLLIFGNTMGALVVNPENLIQTKYKPSVVFTNFQLQNKDIDVHSENSPLEKTIEYCRQITLKYNQSSFSISYAALSYFAPGRNEYAFMLKPFENRWNYVGNQRKATYTNLSPGKYIFYLKAANWDGTWNETPKTIIIKINPPWWKTKLAYLIYFVIAVLIAEIARRIFIRYLKMRNNLRVERKVNEIKLKFFTNISHELRTPLTLIMGPLTDIRNLKKLPAAIAHNIELMFKNGSRMMRLINQLLEFRKIQNEKLKLKVQKVTIKEFIEDVIKNFELISEKKHVKIDFLSQIDSTEAWIDCEKFDIVIFNILSNAFKYSPRNSKVEIKLGFNEKENLISISIKDEGVGIPKNKQPYVFQRFTTLSDTESQYKGYGIGLALSYEIVKLHHGNIFIESEENKGACFIIELPADRNHFAEDEVDYVESKIIEHRHDDLMIEDTAEEETEDIKTTDSKKHINQILVVEDHDEIKEYIQSVLADEYDVITSGNAFDALGKIEIYHPDAIITDIMMPRIDGIEFTRMLKENFDTSHIPVIMLTAKTAFEEQIAGIKSGAEAYILKPFNALHLKTVVRNILKQRELITRRLVARTFSMPDDIKITHRDQAFLEKVKTIITNNYHNHEFNVEKLVEECSVSRTVFYNKMKGLTGAAPVDFLRHMRLEIARKLLEESGENVTDVAYKTGFNDPKYFSKCFKEFFGESPAAVKNNSR